MSEEKVATTTETFMPLNSTEEKKTTKKLAGPKTPTNRAVVYMSHLPHGFYEKELRHFLGQFGSVTNLKVGRSAKTGRSKGYAFIEFKYAEVAQIVAETMNNYLMFEKILKAEIIPQEKVKPGLFKNKVNPNKPPPAAKERYLAKKINNSNKTDLQIAKRHNRQLKKLKKISKALEDAGISSVIEFKPMELPPRVKKTFVEKSTKKSPKIASAKKKTPKSANKRDLMEINPKKRKLDEEDDELKDSISTPVLKKKVAQETPLSEKISKKRPREEDDVQTPKKAKLNETKSSAKKPQTPEKEGKKSDQISTPQGEKSKLNKPQTPKSSSKKPKTPKKEGGKSDQISTPLGVKAVTPKQANKSKTPSKKEASTPVVVADKKSPKKAKTPKTPVNNDNTPKSKVKTPPTVKISDLEKSIDKSTPKSNKKKANVKSPASTPNITGSMKKKKS